MKTISVLNVSANGSAQVCIDGSKCTLCIEATGTPTAGTVTVSILGPTGSTHVVHEQEITAAEVFDAVTFDTPFQYLHAALTGLAGTGSVKVAAIVE